MNIWAVANQKGGVGKTTTTVTLGGILVERGYKVLLIDTDPHASLTYYFGIDSEDLDNSVYDIFMQGKNLTKEQLLQTLCPTSVENMDILPATMALATLDRKMGNQSGMGLVLKNALQLLDDEYDFAIVDCPPVLGVLMVNALAACKRILVPVQTEFLALKGLDRMMRTLYLMSRSQKRDYKYTIIPTMFDKRTRASTEAHKELLETYDDKVWSSVVPVDTKFRDASLDKLVPSAYAPKSRGVIAYNDLLTFLLKVDQ
ncbi:ParA family protein [Catenovulum maritimum]|uniref:Cobalamin biosynthesis protein CobQ n=1 Tax=Catenovulum maritimum TaxID=1513271 RepID=A0A0J8GS15_9ALTE|nr:ParA family protein [Catenovulum maritimum]KMT65502.1 cobalamin biosynthesis protein CobQ [Catenovulum maritimum]